MFWQGFTRLGEAQILLPAALAVYGWTVWRSPAARAGAHRWLLCLAAAAALTTLTKVAFIGWGVGSAALDFTGLSGHAMFAAGILPVLVCLLAQGRAAVPVRAAVAGGYGLAALVGISRVMVDAHSVSEIVGGLACGGLASALALWRGRPWPRSGAVPLALLIGVPLAVMVAMHGAPPSPTHDWVTRLSLHLSGHDQPCTREMLHGSGCAAGRTAQAMKPRSGLNADRCVNTSPSCASLAPSQRPSVAPS